MKISLDFLALLAFAAATAGFVILFNRWGGGGGLRTNPNSTYPTRPVSGGFLPGGVLSQTRNGGVGASSPEVWYN